jgi:hypothetical protein
MVVYCCPRGKAIDDVFPNVQRLLCTKHIKDNISDHLENKNGVTDKDRAEILSEIFGVKLSIKLKLD